METIPTSPTTYFEALKVKVGALNNRLFKDSRITKNRQLASSINIDKYDGVKICNILDDVGFYQGIDACVTKDQRFVQGANLLTDIEFFDTLTASKSNSVFDHIHQCSLQGSLQYSKELYKHPLYDINMLKERITSLQSIEQHYVDNNDTINTLLIALKNNEKYMVWMLEEKEENLKELYDVVFFRLNVLKGMNNSPACLTTYNLYRMFFSPVFGIVSPFLYFIVPYVILLYKLKLKIPFTTYIRTIFTTVLSSDATIFGHGQVFKYIRIISYLFSAVFYLQGIFSSIDLAKTVHKISKLLIGNLNGIVEYVGAYKQLISILAQTTSKNDYAITTAFFDTPSALIEKGTCLTDLVKEGVSCNFSVFKNFGKQLQAFKAIDQDLLKAVLQHSYMIDTLLGAVKYKVSNGFAYPTIETMETKPVLCIEGMVHPCITKAKAVENTVNLGAYGKEQNMIITSPNSSGKSILIKSIIVNVVMAQTMGITSSQNMRITPFMYVNTQINVPDATGHESLFEAEMHRCKHNLDMLEQMNNPSLIVMDEIFNSTNPLEAVAGAYAVCKRMSLHKNNILIFTTHYNYLTKLAKEPNCSFANYRMETIVDGNLIQFTYKFERGVNKHLLALELLKKNGFESSVIEEAISIKNSLQKRVS